MTFYIIQKHIIMEQQKIKQEEDWEKNYQYFQFINILCPMCKLRKGSHSLGQAINCGFGKKYVLKKP